MENEQISTPVSVDNSNKVKKIWRAFRRNLPQIAVYARYVLPVIAAVVVLVLGWFYNVQIASGGRLYEVSLFRLYGSTISGTHEYLGGETAAERTWFYGLLSVGAIVCILCYVIVLFLACLAAYTAIRAFRLGHENEAANRYKLLFKIAFPNRILLFLSNAFLLLPVCYPHFVSFVGSRFLGIGGEGVIYVLFNRPLLVTGIFVALTLILALAIRNAERRKKMNMFLVYHVPDKDEDTEQEEDPEA